MSAALKQSTTTTTTETEPNLLHEIIDRMSVIEAKQSRPSPVQLRSWEEIERFAEKAARSGMVPVGYQNKPDAIVIAVQMGSELGLPPMQALQNIAVVNGRPSVWGDAMPALCRASGVVKTIREWSAGDGDGLTYFCEAVRKDDPNPVLGKFSVADAKRADLWEKAGPWKQYTARMLQMRARGFCLRDAFPDVLRGLVSAEEAQDTPFEATGLTPRTEPLDSAAILGDSIPHMDAPAVKRRTWADFLDDLEPRLKAAQTGNSVDAIVAEPGVQKALDMLRNGARGRLDTMIAEASARTAPVKSQAQVDLEAALARTAPAGDPPDMDGEAEPVDNAPEHEAA